MCTQDWVYSYLLPLQHYRKWRIVEKKTRFNRFYNFPIVITTIRFCWEEKFSGLYYDFYTYTMYVFIPLICYNRYTFHSLNTYLYTHLRMIQKLLEKYKIQYLSINEDCILVIHTFISNLHSLMTSYFSFHYNTFLKTPAKEIYFNNKLFEW